MRSTPLRAAGSPTRGARASPSSCVLLGFSLSVAPAPPGHSSLSKGSNGIDKTVTFNMEVQHPGRAVVSAGKEHVKHALQARYSRSNPASTHRAVAAAAARCLRGGAKRRSSPWTTAYLPGATTPPPHPVLTTVLLGRVQPQSTHSSELCFRALLTRLPYILTARRSSPHARTSLGLSAPLTCGVRLKSRSADRCRYAFLPVLYIPRFGIRAAILAPSLSLLALV